MDVASVAARSGIAPWLVQLVRWETADFTIRWTTGGFLVWGEETFVARDPVYGVLGALPTFEDGIDNQTTRADFSLFPHTQEALAAMASTAHQGSIIEAWEASVDPDTGLLIGEPDELFWGFVDFARLISGEQWELVLECGTEEALLNEPNEDWRLSDSHHQDVWPGELGLSFVTGLGRKIYWRQSQPTAVSTGGGFVGGGGGLAF